MSSNLRLTIQEDLEGSMFGPQFQHWMALESLNTSLVVSWKLNDLSDATGTVTDLTNNNSVSFVPGKIGNCGQFNSASSRYLSHASNATLNMGDIDFTLGAWVYLDSLGSPDQIIIAKEEDGLGLDYRLRVQGAGTNRFQLVASTTLDGVATPGSSVSSGQWYCLLAWHDAAGDKMYLQLDNGTIYSQNTSGALGAPVGAQFRIGARATSQPDYFDGRIDNVCLWKKVLTVAERAAFYHAGNGVEYPF